MIIYDHIYIYTIGVYIYIHICVWNDENGCVTGQTVGLPGPGSSIGEAKTRHPCVTRLIDLFCSMFISGGHLKHLLNLLYVLILHHMSQMFNHSVQARSFLPFFRLP